MEEKESLRFYLVRNREALLYKLDGLSERDARYPLTGTGTNVLGLFKHAVSTEAGYLGEVFGRPFPEGTPWLTEESEPNADMWATPDQTIEWLRDFADRVWRHCDSTLDELPLDAAGVVPWWPPERQDVTLHQIVVAVIAEYARHAGHADIVRELIDGRVGLSDVHSNMPVGDAAWWRDYVARLRAIAESFATP